MVFVQKRIKRTLALALCLVLLFGSVTNASAASTTATSNISLVDGIAGGLNTALNRVLGGFLGVFAELLPASVKVGKVKDYQSENFYSGSEEFVDQPQQDAKWQLGYASASIVPDDFSKGIYYKGGYDVNYKMKDLLDDLRVRVIALNDGSGRGTSVFAVIDCLGLANEDVRQIRAALSDFAKENNIISINVSATHTHSGIDTQGIYTNIYKKVLVNMGRSIIGSDNLMPAVDENFLNLLINQTVKASKEAVQNMTPGSLKYAHTDIQDYVRDRTEPDISIDELYRLTFLPDDGSKGTIIANFGVHPENIGYGTKYASSDFIYYTEKIINQAGFNFMFIQGAVGTITEKTDMSGDGITKDRLDSTIRYGEEIGYILLGMTLTKEECIEKVVDPEREAQAAESETYTPWYENHQPVEEEELAPVLNIRLKEIMVPVDNGVYKAFGKLSLANNKMLFDEKQQMLAVTEVGYMELGKVKIILCPGETYAELIKDGENMKNFPYESAYEVMKSTDVLVFDLMNDAAGYIMPDDYFTYVLVSNKNGKLNIGSAWGLTSLGKSAASNIYGEIYQVYESVR